MAHPLEAGRAGAGSFGATTERPRTDAGAVFGRAIRWGMTWGAVFGALAGLPVWVIGALPGAIIGGGAGLASCLVPGVLLAVKAQGMRENLVVARWMAGVLAALPALGWAAVAQNAGGRSFLAACGAAAGITAALLTRRILNGRVARRDDDVPQRDFR